MPPLDTTPLTSTPTPEQVSAQREWERQQPKEFGNGWGMIVGVVMAVFALVMIATVLGGMVASGRFGGLTLLPIVTFSAIAVIGLAIYVAKRRSLSIKQRVVVRQMSERHGLRFQPTPVGRSLSGLIFQVGSGRRIGPSVHDDRDGFEMGTAWYTVKQGKSSSTYRWGFMAIPLDRPLPNMLLDARGNGRALPIAMARNQRLDLEGDFPEHFNLYVPEGYERDALYIFTPDLMALCIDEAGDFDVEIVDNWMFIYAPHDIDLSNPGLWERAWKIRHVVAERADYNAQNWSDEHYDAERDAQIRAFAAGTAPNFPARPIGVAPQGRRLQRAKWPAVVAIGMIAVFVIFRILIAIAEAS